MDEQNIQPIESETILVDRHTNYRVIIQLYFKY